MPLGVQNGADAVLLGVASVHLSQRLPLVAGPVVPCCALGQLVLRRVVKSVSGSRRDRQLAVHTCESIIWSACHGLQEAFL